MDGEKERKKAAQLQRSNWASTGDGWISCICIARTKRYFLWIEQFLFFLMPMHNPFIDVKWRKRIFFLSWLRKFFEINRIFFAFADESIHLKWWYTFRWLICGTKQIILEQRRALSSIQFILKLIWFAVETSSELQHYIDMRDRFRFICFIMNLWNGIGKIAFYFVFLRR